MTRDNQLHGVTIDEVVEKRRLGQALNAKEFAVLAGISYSAAREWFRLPGFPVFRGIVFWQDFTDWRRGQAFSMANSVDSAQRPGTGSGPESRLNPKDLPPRAARILLEG